MTSKIDFSMRNRVFAMMLLGMALFMASLGGFAQGESLFFRGVVLDASSHAPVAYAHVLEEGSARGVTTDEEGKFQLSLRDHEGSTLVISHLGYEPQKLVIHREALLTPQTFYLKPVSMELSDVVISASLYEQPMKNLTRSAHLIPPREIVSQMRSNMADLLADIPGFTQVWEYHSPIILRGLNSNRLLILKDGNRRIGTFPGGYFGQDMNIYDTKRVEVIKGPGSVIYGSGAISGIINVISDEPFDGNENRVQIHSGYGSNNNEFLEILKVRHKREKFGFSLNGKYRKTGAMRYGGGEIAKNSDVEDRDVALNTGYKFSEVHKVLLNATYHYGDWGKPRGFNGPTKFFTKIRNKEQSFHADMSYTYSPKNKIVEFVRVNFFYDDGWRDYYQYKFSAVSGRVSSLNLHHYKNDYGGTRIFTKIRPSENHTLTTGVDGYYFRLDNPLELFDFYNDTHGYVEGSKNTGQDNLSAFVRDEWSAFDRVRLITGLRYDLYRVIEGEGELSQARRANREALSGNVGVVYAPKESFRISLNAGRAFRMPTAEELYVKVVSCKGVKQGNPALSPEYGWNFDLGLRGQALDHRMKFDLALFHNLLDGFINEAPSDDPDVDFTLENTNAQLTGGELSLAYRIPRVFGGGQVLTLRGGASYVYGVELSDDQSKPLFGMPPLTVKLDLRYQGTTSYRWLTGYVVRLNPAYAAPQKRVAEIPEGTGGGPWGYVPSEAHFVINASLELRSHLLPGHPQLRLVCENLLDDDYRPFGSYIPAMGRNIKLILSFSF
ncbi:MAG: hypothetical protein CSA04_00890 [Bacteroidetes bacterium]|nr:MAG: hypothetical protein CSA04_00890 [Bacteroidota bacterium]